MRLIDASFDNAKVVLEPVPYYPDEIWKFAAMAKRFPIIEAEPVRHGRWVNIMSGIIDTIGDCANCGQEAVWRTRNKPYAVCPNCGAKMDGDGHV